MVIIEAMSHSKPIVASNVGGISEIVKNGVNGYTTKNDSTAMANAIKLIMSDKVLKENMGIKSHVIYESKLTLKRMTEKYLLLYNRIVDNNQ